MMPQSSQAIETAPRGPGVRQALMDDHRRIADLGRTVATCVDADDPHGALAEWSTFEAALLRHMDLEEVHVFPRLEVVEPEETRRLLAEHGAIRSELGEIGLALELHIARKATIDALLARVSRHAQREDELAYRWADRALHSRVPAMIVRGLG